MSTFGGAIKKGFRFRDGLNGGLEPQFCGIMYTGVSGIGILISIVSIISGVGIGIFIGAKANWSATRAVVCSVSIEVHSSRVSSCLVGTLSDSRELMGSG